MLGCSAADVFLAALALANGAAAIGVSADHHSPKLVRDFDTIKKYLGTAFPMLPTVPPS
jgi:uncharacterized protein YozE (UPF0346 family)